MADIEHYLRLLKLADADLTEDAVNASVRAEVSRVAWSIEKLRGSSDPDDLERLKRLRLRLKRIRRSGDFVKAWLANSQAFELSSGQGQKPATRPDSVQINFWGLLPHEAEYAAGFYAVGVCRIRDLTSIDDFTEPNLMEPFGLNVLPENLRPRRLAQMGWPFPESEDSQREFGGAIAVIRFIRALVGEPKHQIDEERRLLIEGSCLYADDSTCATSSPVSIEELKEYVNEHADESFEYWDRLQIVFCYFLGVRTQHPKSANADYTFLSRVDEIIQEIEMRLNALPQEVILPGIAAADKLQITVRIKPADIANELLGAVSIADAITGARHADFITPLESVPYCQRQFSVLSRSPGKTHALIRQQKKTGKFSVLERNLIRHRVSSWLQRESRKWSWNASKAVSPKTGEVKRNSNLIGTQRIGFLPLGDFISLALGMPTTGHAVFRDLDFASQTSRLSSEFSAKNHVDAIIAGLLGGTISPTLIRGHVACCGDCGTLLLNRRCINRECDEWDQVPESFDVKKMLLMSDKSLFIPVEATEENGSYAIAEYSTNQRKISTVYLAVTSASEFHKQTRDTNTGLLLEECQEQLLNVFPNVFKSLESVSLNPDDRQSISFGDVLRHRFAVPVKGVAMTVQRSWGWIRADCGDFSVWPPRMLTPGEIVEKTNKAFWDAFKVTIREDEFARSLLATIPSPRDRIVCLHHFAEYPKANDWLQRYQKKEAENILPLIGIRQGAAASAKEVTQIVCECLLDWVIPGLQSPWHAFMGLNNTPVPVPWKELGEFHDWWSALEDEHKTQHEEHLDDAGHRPAFEDFINRKLEAPDWEALSMEEQKRLDDDDSQASDTGNVVSKESFKEILERFDGYGKALWIIAWRELRKYLYDQMKEEQDNAQMHFVAAQDQTGGQS